MIDSTMRAPEPGHFLSSYRLSRERLLDRARALTASHGLVVDSRTLTQRGPEQETLAQDFLIFGARKPKYALVISSGTHGVEGFAGSAIQHQLLVEQLPLVTLSGDTAVILLHANNPYGFAWLRRVTENNVDMNRNFRESFDNTEVSPDYETLFDALNPTDLNPDNEAMRWAALERFVQEFGLRRCQQAVIEGQYKYPHGVQFGGHQSEPCTQHLLDLVQEHLSQTQELLWIDVHTGLGEFGDCELISTYSPESTTFKAARQVWGDGVRSTQAGDSLSTELNGVMDVAIGAHLPPDCQLAMIAAEFGTYPVDRVIRAMRADNWLHQHGPQDLLNDPQAREIKAELLEVFRPDRAEWRAQILQTGRQLVEQGLTALPGAVRND